MTTIDLDTLRPVATNTDDELMTRLDQGFAEQSLAELQARYSRTIFKFVNGIVRDRQLAEDVCQEVFAKIFFKSHLYRTGSNFQAWLFEVARNQALTALRTRRLAPMPAGSLQPHVDDTDGSMLLRRVPDVLDPCVLEEEELMTALGRAVAELPEHYREPFELCVQGGMKYQDAAQLLRVPTGTVAIRIMRARQRLFAELAPLLGRVRRPPACMQVS